MNGGEYELTMEERDKNIIILKIKINEKQIEEFEELGGKEKEIEKRRQNIEYYKKQLEDN